MAIPQSTLKAKAALYTKSVRTAQEARSIGKKTVFLCHSHKDQELVKGLIRLLADANWDVYVDWLDETMPEKPNGETARRIKTRIRESDALVFLATEHSMASRWCPWEIGIADEAKSASRVFIVPTTTGYSTFGSEYLDLYKRIIPGDGDVIGIFEPGKTSGTRIDSVRL